jgi:vacuolar protein sorting-associated protein 53
MFSHPSTLSSVSKAANLIRVYEQDLEDEIDLLDEHQSVSNTECMERMAASQAELSELFKKIDDVRERALQTEKNITDMTADIKQLDNTKKNLTLSMTALKRLQMLTTAYEQLTVLGKTRQYRECAQLLQAVIQLMAHFKSYRSIDQIAALSRNVADLQRELLEQVCEDFELAFAKGEVAQNRVILSEGCLVMDALGENARSRIITWYCNTQLREYRQVFRGSEEAGSLDNISRRYAWFRRMLKTYDEEHAVIFPQHWRVNEVIANVFCEGTRDDYKSILSRTTRSGQILDVNLLLSCLQETLDFEHSLERRFASTSRASIDTVTSASEAIVFNQPISDAFEPYLGVWVESQDKQLQTMIQKYRQQPLRPPDEEFNSQQVISSSTELFNFYRHSLAQCAKLSVGQPLLELSRAFARHLEQYSQQVLLHHISERPTGGTPSRIPTVQDLVPVLNTADYCYNTCAALEEKIKSRIDEPFRAAVDLQSQADAFMGIASASVRGLVRSVEVDLEPSWREMRNIAWGRIESVDDQSSYVQDLTRRIKDRSSEIVGMLHKPQYARAFADNLVELLANAYLANIVQCKPVSEGGAEQVCFSCYASPDTIVLIALQMLLDTHAVRSTLLAILPSPPAAFTKRVHTSISKVEPLLKTLQVHPQPPEALIQAYLVHIADLSDANFRKILDLKGIKNKSEQSHLVELYQMHKLSERYKASVVEKSPLLTPLTISAATGQGLGQLGAGAAATLSTANLPANMKFDPRGFGDAIMDRFASPSLGGVGTPRDGAQSPPNADGGANHATNSLAGTGAEAGAKLNENLKNIGKFFRRDLGGFGGRFGSSRSPAPEDRS